MILKQNNDGSVSLTSDGMAMNSFSVITKMSASDDILKYIYYMYDPNSRYINMLPGSRDTVIRREIVKSKIDIKNKDIAQAIDTYIQVSTDPKFQLLEGVKTKIEEYIKWWKDTKIDANNHRTIADSLKNAQSLLIIRKQMEDEVMDSKKSKDFGGGSATLFEDGED